MPARNKSIYLHFIPIWILYLQPLLHFLNFVITFKLFSEMAFFRTPQWWKRCKIWVMWWVGKNSPFERCDCFPYFQSCLWSCIIMLKEDFHNILVGSDSPEMILQGFKSLNIQIWINGLTTWHAYQITPFASLNRWVMTVPAEGVVLKFHLPRWSWMMPFHWFFVCS
jgi:hypothetical protein